MDSGLFGAIQDSGFDLGMIIMVILEFIFLLGIVIGILAFIYRKIGKNHINKILNEAIYQPVKETVESIKDDNKILHNSMKSLQRAKISDIHRRGMRNGYVTRYELMVGEDVYKDYKADKGNSYADTMVEDIRSWTVKD